MQLMLFICNHTLPPDDSSSRRRDRACCHRPSQAAAVCSHPSAFDSKGRKPDSVCFVVYLELHDQTLSCLACLSSSSKTSPGGEARMVVTRRQGSKVCRVHDRSVFQVQVQFQPFPAQVVGQRRLDSRGRLRRKLMDNSPFGSLCKSGQENVEHHP